MVPSEVSIHLVPFCRCLLSGLSCPSAVSHELFCHCILALLRSHASLSCARMSKLMLSRMQLSTMVSTGLQHRFALVLVVAYYPFDHLSQLVHSFEMHMTDSGLVRQRQEIVFVSHVCIPINCCCILTRSRHLVCCLMLVGACKHSDTRQNVFLVPSGSGLF